MAALTEPVDKAAAGMAKDIRASSETSQWDLGGYTNLQVTNLVKAAFSEPVRLSEMIRHTFVVGGGKKVRQKYDDKMGRWLATALTEAGYTEDRGASTNIECAGTFKQQHDTDKDLKFVHVFPKVDLKPSGGGGEADAEASSLVDLGSPAYLATMCSFETFKKMVASKTESWSQRKRLMEELKLALARFDAIEAKMISAQPLSSEEQDLYDQTSREGIDEKLSWLETQIKTLVEQGILTAGEKQQLLSQIEGRIGAVTAQLAEAETAGAQKRAEKMKTQLQQVTARRDKVRAVEPIRHELRHEAKIKALRVAIVPLVKLEAAPGLRSMEEMKKIGTRPELEAEAAKLEAESRGWFETDAEFEARCTLIKAAAEHKAESSSKAAAKKAASKSASASDQWETIGSQGGRDPRRKW